MTLQPFQGTRQGEELPDLFVVPLFGLEAGFHLDRFVELYVEDVRDELCDPVYLTVRHVQGPADIADHGLRLHRPEGDDLGDPVGAVLLGDVTDDLFPALHAEVRVDVGHPFAVRVQKPLEEEAVPDRVDARYPESIGDEAPGDGAPPRPDRYVPAPGVVDEIGDD